MQPLSLEQLYNQRLAANNFEKAEVERAQKRRDQTKRNARERVNAKRERFFDQQVEIAELQESRRKKIKKAERKERLSEVRKARAKVGYTRANLASRHTKDHRHSAILGLLKGLMDKNSKVFCFPSQETICWMLWRYYGINVSRRTLNYDLQELDDAGAIKRKRRHKKAGRGIQFSSTLYLITNYGKKWLSAAANLFKFLRSSRVQNTAQPDVSFIKSKRLLGDSPHPDQTEGSPTDGFYDFLPS